MSAPTLVKKGTLPEYRMARDTPGETITGPAWVHQVYVPGYGYRDEGRVKFEDRVVTFTVPTDLHDKLVKTRGAAVTITYTGKQGAQKLFTVEPAVAQPDDACAMCTGCRVLAYVKDHPGASYNQMVSDFIEPLVCGCEIDALKADIEAISIEMEDRGEILFTVGGIMTLPEAQS